MPTIQGRTRKELRQSIGYNLGAMRVGSATENGTRTSDNVGTLIDLSLTTVIGGDDDHIGKWIVFTSGNNDGDIARVTDYTASNTTLTFQADAAVAIEHEIAAGNTYELWDMDYSPSMIHDMINQAVINATGHVYDPVEKLDLHADGKQLRFDVPSGMSMVQDIYYRDKVDSTSITNCNSVFDETIDSDFTVTADTEIKKQGTASNRILVAGGVGTGATGGELATDSITSKDISKYDYIEFWIKCTIATSAANLKIHLDNTASCVSPLESLDVPALTADTWKFVRVALSNPESNAAIISVGLEYDVDIGGCTIWLDDIRVVRNDSAQWETVPRNLWKIDREANQIVFESYFKNFGYKLLKLVGGDKPALLSADTTASEIDDQYIIATATALAFSASSGGPATDPESRRQQAAFWFGMSERSKRAFPLLRNVRTV